MKIKNNPKITIITVTYNAEKYLERTIKSIIEQDYPNIEYIIIDGASTDSTLEIIKKYEKYITHWISEPDRGIYDAMNKGIDVATGEWINFMNAGDSFCEQNTISRVLLENHYDYDLLCGEHNLYLDDLYTHCKLDDNWAIHKKMPACHQSIFMKTLILKKYFFDLKYQIAADYDLIYKVYFDGFDKIKFYNFPISNFLNDGLTTHNKDIVAFEYVTIFNQYSKDLTLLSENFGFQYLCEHAPLNYIFSKSFNLFYSQIEQIKEKYKKIALYGYGTVGKTIVQLLKDNIEVIIDKNKISTQEFNVPIVTVEELKNYSYDIVLISVLGRERDIINILVQNNVVKEDIFTFKI